MRTHTVRQPVRYVETDRMQVVHHSTYLVWFEIARTGLLAEAGFPYRELERHGTLLPVVEFSCRIEAPLDYGDVVDIEAAVARVRSRSVVFRYAVTSGGRAVARGETKHVPVGPTMRPKRLPDDLYAALSRWAADQ